MNKEVLMLSLSWWEILIAGISTLAIYSFLYRENSFYRFFEHLYIGIATAWGIIATFKYFLYPQVIKPILGLDLPVFPDGTSEPYNYMNLFLLLPISFGLLYYCLLSKNYAWLAQIVIGFQLGFSAGLSFKGTFTELLPQLYSSFKPLYVHGDLFQSLTNIFFITTLFCTMLYFLFTFKRTNGSVLAKTNVFGRWLMMGCFGAFFGSTIMARMALLVERLDFLLNTWIPNLYS